MKKVKPVKVWAVLRDGKYMSEHIYTDEKRAKYWRRAMRRIWPKHKWTIQPGTFVPDSEGE